MNTFDWMMDDAAPSVQPAAFYLPEAADCIRCGLCVSTCPTYQVNPVYEESPRGRVRLLDKVLNQQQPLTGSEREHLQHCTLCRACETVCPSRMSYGQAFDAAQQRLAPKSRPWLVWLGFKLIEHPAWLQFGATALMVYQGSGLQTVVRQSGWLEKLNLDKAEALLPAVTSKPLAKIYPANAPHRGCVGLFTGCLAPPFDRQTVDDVIKVINRLGFDVLIPSQQRCCGAIHQHQGEAETARRMMAENKTVFDGLDCDAVVYIASACGLMLSEYEQALQKPLLDICDFINQHWRDYLTVNPLPQTVAVHEPCSQRNSLKNQQAVYDMLGKIPALTPLPLPENGLCCGAGGVNAAVYPELAEPLRDRKIAAFAECQAQVLVTANIGCSLHLQTGMQTGQVLHPVSVLAKQLRKQGSSD